jgi:hypothetical protein
MSPGRPHPLPEWRLRTPAVLCTAGPHAIPVSTGVRAADDRLLFALGGRRETLRRLRDDPRAAYCLLAADLAFTAYGDVGVVEEQLGVAPVAALELRVERVQDHLTDGRTELLEPARWRWRDEGAREKDREVLAALERLAGREPTVR